MAEPIQRERGDAVARRQRLVRHRLAAVDQRLVPVRGEEETPAPLVAEVRQQAFREPYREVEVLRTPAGLQQFERRVEQERVVVEVGVEARAPILPGRQQPVVDDEPVADEVHAGGCRIGEFRSLQPDGGDRQPANHQRVPARQDLVVAPRPDARVAGRE